MQRTFVLVGPSSADQSNLVPRARVTFIQFNVLPVPLDNGNAGSGNEIGTRVSGSIFRCAERMRSNKEALSPVAIYMYINTDQTVTFKK